MSSLGRIGLVLLVAAFSQGAGSWAGTSLVVNRLITVSAAGTPAENCQSLLDALDAIDDASSSNAYLLKLEPGDYSCGASVVGMKPFVSIEGAGRSVTRIEGSGAATVAGSADNELRHVTVEHNSGTGTAIAMSIGGDADSPRITHVDFVVTATGNAFGLFINSGASPVLHDVAVTVNGGASSVGIALTAAAPIMDGVRVLVAGADFGTGILSGGDDPVPGGERAIVRNATVAVSSNNESRGLDFSFFSVAPIVSGVDVRVKGGASNYAVHNNQSDLEIRHSYLESSPTALAPLGESHFGVYNVGDTGGFEVLIENSEIKANISIRNPAGFTTRVASSQMGFVADDGGTMVCIHVWDDELAAVTCP